MSNKGMRKLWRTISMVVGSKVLSYGFIAFVLYDINWLLELRPETAGWVALRGWAASTALVFIYRIWSEWHGKSSQTA